MALTNSQVQQVYLAITGRPAEGNAVTWASSANSVAELANQIIDIRKNSDFTSNEQFVNHLYQYLLNDTAPDAEGVAYWTGLLKGSKAEDGTEIPAISKAELIEQFINAVMAQNQTDHKYTLENKTQIAVEFGDDVKSFVGGKQAETYLRDVVFNHVDKNTSYADIEEYATNFKGQYVNVASVTVQQGAEEATEGSETNATTYNATLDLAGDGDIQINGSTDYSDTLNLKVTGDTDNQELTGANFSNIGSVKNVNIDMNNANAAKVTLNTNDIVGVQNLVIKGSSVDNITVDKALASLDTGAGADVINLNKVVGSVQAGAGNDVINITAAANSASSTINGGAGTDILSITGANQDISKVTLTGIEAIAGQGIMSSTQLNSKSYTLGADVDGTGAIVAADLTVKAEKGVNLSNLKVAEGANPANTKFTVENVKSGTITLIKGNTDVPNPTADTINLTKATGNVTIKNYAGVGAGNDQIKLAAGADQAAVIDDTTKLYTGGASKVVVGAGVDTALEGKTIVTGGKASADLVTAFAAATTAFTDATQKGYFAFHKGEKTYVYEVTNNGTVASKIDAKDSVKLISTIDAVLTADDFDA